MTSRSLDSYFDPPADNWGECPRCGCSQEDAELLGTGEYLCPCGRRYEDEDAHTDPQEMRDEARMREAGL